VRRHDGQREARHAQARDAPQERLQARLAVLRVNLVAQAGGHLVQRQHLAGACGAARGRGHQGAGLRGGRREAGAAGAGARKGDAAAAAGGLRLAAWASGGAPPGRTRRDCGPGGGLQPQHQRLLVLAVGPIVHPGPPGGLDADAPRARVAAEDEEEGAVAQPRQEGLEGGGVPPGRCGRHQARVALRGWGGRGAGGGAGLGWGGMELRLLKVGVLGCVGVCWACEWGGGSRSGRPWRREQAHMRAAHPRRRRRHVQAATAAAALATHDGDGEHGAVAAAVPGGLCHCRGGGVGGWGEGECHPAPVAGSSKPKAHPGCRLCRARQRACAAAA
jgi:hypothetical protein